MRTDNAPDPHIRYRRHELTRSTPGLPDGPVIAMRDGACLVRRDDESGEDSASVCSLPRLSELDVAAASVVHEIAIIGGEPVYCLTLPDVPPADRDDAIAQADPGVPSDDTTDAPAGEGLEWGGYRDLFGVLPETGLGLLGRAMQVLAWDETSRFCSCCGEKTTAHDSECVKQCEQCGHTQYPRLAPAMIVGVVRDGKLLLAQSPRFKGVFHSILAGFVEPGETAEECVRREVFEEVGIRVRDIRYFGSQSWPFPHSFMLGFTASWEAGEINPDPDEIAHADWYAPDEMPATPSEVSISGRIIRWFRESYGALP